VLSVKCYDAIVNGCETLNFGTVTVGESGKERVEKCCIVLSVKC